MTAIPQQDQRPIHAFSEMFDIYFDHSWVTYTWAYGPYDAVARALGKEAAEEGGYVVRNIHTGKETAV